MKKLSSNIITRIATFAIPVLWTIFFYPLIYWILNSYSLHNNWFGIYAAILVIFITVYNFSKTKVAFWKQIYFNIKIFPLIIIILSIIGYIISKLFLDIKIIQSIFFGFGTYGILGLYLNKNVWKKIFIPFILIIQTLPFGSNLDTYIGFPLRIFTTNAVENMLSGLGIENLRNQTIFVIENRAANIDISCSGMKGIWAASIVFLMLIFIENKKIDYRAIITFFILIFSLIFFNILRVSIIIYTYTVLNLPKLAEIFHRPLGIIGFVFSLIIVWLLIKYFMKNSITNFYEESKIAENKIKYSTQISVFFTLILFILIFVNFNKNKVLLTKSEDKVNIETKIELNEISLSENEKSLMISGKNDVSEKFSFDDSNISGSILISKTENWMGHHKPEICYTADGFEIENSKTVCASDNFFIKEITFKNTNFKAYYWFQSKNKTTDDFSARIWSALNSENTTWTMVSVFLSDKSDTEKSRIFFTEIKNQIQ